MQEKKENSLPFTDKALWFQRKECFSWIEVKNGNVFQNNCLLQMLPYQRINFRSSGINGEKTDNDFLNLNIEQYDWINK